MLQETILKEAPHLHKKIVMGYRTLDGEFCEINGEVSNLRCLMNTLCIIPKNIHTSPTVGPWNF